MFVVPVYSGMSRSEALALTFGNARPPAGSEIVFVENATPPEGFGITSDWFQYDDDSFSTAYAACEAHARRVNGLDANFGIGVRRRHANE